MGSPPTTSLDPGPVRQVLTLLDGVRETVKDSQWVARCPSHNDKTPSLSVGVGEGGRALLRCQAGCTTEAVLSALRMSVRDLFDTTDPPGQRENAGRAHRPPRMRKAHRDVTAPAAPPDRRVYDSIEQAMMPVPGAKTAVVWDYHDAAGNVVFHVARFDTQGAKTFRPYAVVAGGLVRGDPEEPLPLYGLPELLASTDAVYVVEGEGCADRARECGLCATTSSHGNCQAHRTDWSPLAGRDVTISPDNDEPGRKYAADVAGILTALSPPATVRTLPALPGVAEGGDIVDFAAARTPKEVRAALTDLRRKSEPAAKPGPVVRCMRDIQREDIDPLWLGRIALGKMTVIGGDGGLGKTFLSLDIASRVSRGAPWPDCRDENNPAGDVILMTCEDGLADTVRPRLDHAQADLDRVFVLEGVRQPEEPEAAVMFSIERDLRHLRTVLDDHPQTRLVIIDPLTAHLGKHTDAHRDAEVRRTLGPLAKLAEECHVAVLCIMHVNKSTKNAALYRTLGSVAFVNAARAVWLVSKDREDATRRLFAQVKNNLGPDPGTLAFSIADPGCVNWEDGTVPITADELFSEQPSQAHTVCEDAIAFLRERLADGPTASNALFKQAEEGGISRSTMYRAKKKIGIVARSRPSEGGAWYWELAT